MDTHLLSFPDVWEWSEIRISHLTDVQSHSLRRNHFKMKRKYIQRIYANIREAETSGNLYLTEFGLEEIPREVF